MRTSTSSRALFLAAVCFPALSGLAGAGEESFPRFRAHEIDRPGGRAWGQTSLVDVDRDGDLDFISGRRDDEVFWFEFQRADRWVRHSVGRNRRGETDVGGVALDVDGDGEVDQVSGRTWYRNAGKGASFEKYDNGSIGAAHDCYSGDIDGDGKPDLISMKDTKGLYWYAIPDEPRKPWREHRIGEGVHGGVAVGDLDGDGDRDVVRSNWWFENRDGKGTEWTVHRNIDFGRADAPYPFQTSARVVDLDRDGRLDLVMAEGDLPRGRVAWFRNADGKGRDWKRTLIAGERGDLHSLQVADFDGDGDLDAFSGDGPLTPEELQPHRWYIWENVDGKGREWKQHVVLKGYRCHEAVAGDVDGDGDIDICSKPWNGDVHVYLENLSKP